MLLEFASIRCDNKVFSELGVMDYYRVVDQAEYATDLMFRSASALKDLYENLLKHAVTDEDKH